MIRDLLLPATDLAVGIQLGLLVALSAVALWATRRRPDLRLLATGTSVMLVALMGLRAAH